ncbi:GIY-YIG nuclease family protein [Aspergillus fijiensis CBS 313.89]|uniref:DUF1766-domain-containing protein n=1 Tax=Aspergillus fijiensis CBS 313.89 TaxID=1448319 RepID=A0A8G1RN53_9EURO|nr:DUF1766-domain-containing protein [Aspergillus fijiensis CBS 313.89]RAK74456.1 DUF1766-domain-containing protein [Aspergillus fijiensis CBS 313.89]
MENPPRPSTPLPLLLAPSPPTSPGLSERKIDVVKSERKDTPARALKAIALPNTPPSSPPQLGPGSSEEPESPSPLGVFSVAQLKIRLGLETETPKCGAMTRKERGCRNPRRATEKDELDQALTALLNLTQSSPELPQRLTKLASLVHCHMHDYSTALGRRVVSWSDLFPLGDLDAKIFSAMKRIRDELPEASKTCIGISSKKKQCRLKLSGKTVQTMSHSIQEILKPQVFLRDEVLEIWIQHLREAAFCCYHKNQCLSKAAGWIKAIKTARSLLESSPPPPDTADATNKTTPDQLDTVSSTLREIAKHWKVTGYDTSPLRILSSESWNVKDWSSEKYQDRILVVLENLEGEERRGYVYVYEIKGNEGYVKVGYTEKKTAQERMNEWSETCNRQITGIYPRPVGLERRIHSPALVEILCHADLRTCRVRVDCEACLHPHSEWFQTSPQEAVDVVEKWSRWIDETAGQPGWRDEIKAIVLESADMEHCLESLLQIKICDD